jgi:holo-[acyl-carrier protein] synthase
MTTPALACEVAPVGAMPDPSDPRWREWLTAAERAYCAGLQRAGEHLAARVLAKRAAARAIGWPGVDVPWEGIEVLREPLHPPQVYLTGAVEQWREECGVPVPGVSLSHAAGYAAAVAWLPEVG